MNESERKFNEIMKKEGLEKLTKRMVYVVRYQDPQHPEGPQKLDEFKTKEELDKWYEEVGREIENLYGGKIEVTKEPSEQ